jgi:hypothetical protein
MSIIFSESFDKYGTDVSLLAQGVWTDEGPAGASLVAGGGRCGTTAYRNTTITGRGPAVGLVTADQFTWGHVAIRIDSSPIQDGNDDIAFREAGGINQTFFVFKMDGSIEIWSGPNEVLGIRLGQSAAGVFSSGQWFSFEWEVLIDPSAGTFQAWVDGVEVIAKQTGQDTRANPSFGTSGPYTQIIIQHNGDSRIDDVVFGNGIDSGVAGKPNNTRLGPLHVSAQLAELDSVSGGGFHKDFTPLSGADHGAMVDENPPDDDTTYNSSSAPTKEDTYSFPDIALASGDVFAVNILPMVKKSDNSNTRQIKPMLRSAGADTLGTAQAVPASQYEYRWEVFNGIGATAWTVGLVNAAEFGLQDFA